LLHEASTTSVLWAVSLQPLTGSCVLVPVLLVRRPGWNLGWRDARPLLLVGALDQTANARYGLASTVGLVSLSAVLASLYPVMTIVLARLALRERVSPIQQTGVALVLAGVALVASD
jgi:drug/metabolite transporter (DMT)-like permease